MGWLCRVGIHKWYKPEGKCMKCGTKDIWYGKRNQ